MAQDFKKLRVWKEGIELSKSIYRVTRCFPASELFGLTSQLRRAAVSVPTNIAEGCGRSSSADFLRFLYLSFGSVKEVESLLILSKEVGYLKEKDTISQLEKVDEVGRMLNRLITAIKGGKDVSGD